MSSSVIMARTLICRMAVAITRGGNLCGAIWQRPQLVRNLFSPSTRSARSTTAASSAVAAEDGEAGFAAGVAPATRVGTGVAALDEVAELVRSCAIAEKVKPAITPRKQSRM